MWDWLSLLEKYRKEKVPLALVTVTQCIGSTPCKVGSKMIVLRDGKTFGTIGGGNLEQIAIEKALACITLREHQAFRFPLGCRTGQCCGGTVEVFMEVLNTNPRVYIFGAGHVGQALVHVLSGTAFEIHLLDGRKDWAKAQNLPSDIYKHEANWEQLIDEVIWDKNLTYVVIMTPHHDVDERLLAKALPKDRFYLGLIGSLPKWATFQDRLLGQGFTSDALAAVRCPIGLDIGGKSPAEIAISIAAELIKLQYGKCT